MILILELILTWWLINALIAAALLHIHEERP